MTLYIGVDFHPHQQTLSWCDTETGETDTVDLFHDNLERVKEFYSLLKQPAIIGVEASCRAQWFEDLLYSTNHKLLVGDPFKISRSSPTRHKSDKIAAEHMLDLLMADKFPAIWRRTPEQNEVLDILRMRLKLVGQRTATYNRLQALAHTAGLPKGRMRTDSYQKRLEDAELREAGALQRQNLFFLLRELNERIAEFEAWLKKRAERDPKVSLLMTQKGVGYLTALAVVNTLGDVSRFDNVPKQVTSFIGYDCLKDFSAGKKRHGSITKAGSPLVRYLVGQAAQSVIRHDPKLKSFHKRLSRRKPKKVAKTAAARKLLVKLAIMLRDNISAQEFDRRGRAVGDARWSAGSEMTVA